MSKKHRKFSSEFKAKVVLELLEGDKSVSEIASKYGILPKSIHQWKKQFLENASLAFENAVPAKKYKEEIREKESQIEALSKALGQATIERDWVLKKLKSLGLKTKKSLVEPKLKNLSITRQTELLGMNRSTLYYKNKPEISEEDIEIMNAIDEIYTEFPYYGYRRIYHQLRRKGFDNVGKRRITRFMKIMGIRALYPKRKRFKTTELDKNTKAYPYLLNDIIPTKPNQVWVSDITYIRLCKGFAYLCVIMDLKSRAVLSHKLSPTMDDELVVRTIESAIEKYGRPDIFNSDQGSQYTSNRTIELLKKHNISISMDAKGRCFDNIHMERFFRSLKQENIYPSCYERFKDAKTGIDEYIHTYNSKRLHSAIGYKTPFEVYGCMSETKENIVA
ncbi:IS3 family transposase [Hippea sp. KM1]|uniref:IS3 family transposase n=1 Tax=Hippea sp. KM1 TaxID=944481 RepID=UPI00046D4F13|nr:IS3 family transposase [Hippea sp. KM1]